MRLKLTFVVVCFAFCQSVAQRNLDSLYGLWQNTTLSVSIRVDAFDKYISKGYVYANPDTAYQLAGEMIAFGVENANLKAEAIGYYLQATSLNYKTEYDASLATFQKSLRIAKKLNDPETTARILNSLGLNYQTEGNYPMALTQFQESLAIYEKIEDKRGIAYLQNNIGNVYKYQGSYRKALLYYSKSLKMKKAIGNFIGQTTSLNNIGHIHRLQKEYSIAIPYYEASLQLSDSIGYVRGQGSSYNNLGLVHKEMGKYEQAQIYFKKGLAKRKSIGHKWGVLSSKVNIGITYNLQGKPAQAIGYCLSGYDESNAMGAVELEKTACSCLYEAYKSVGNEHKALAYLEALSELEKNELKEETTEVLQLMEFNKQRLADSIVKAQEAQLIEEQHKAEVAEKNKTRNILLSIGFMLCLGAGFILWRLRYMRKANELIAQEKARSDGLLLNILPANIAEELKNTGKAEAQNFDQVSILFTDFKAFSLLSEKMTAKVLVNELNECFKAFDSIVEKYDIEKIKTIGDAYMAAGGLSSARLESTENTVLAAIEMQEFMMARKQQIDKTDILSFEMRAGIHTGNVVAGIVGVKKFQYDIWGDTVNIASRIESNGEVGRVNISENTYNLLKASDKFSFTNRGEIQTKGKGKMTMYFVERRT